jgi:hypothetical protein
MLAGEPRIGAVSGADQVTAELVRAFDVARAAGDVDAMASAALELAATQVFGTVPGRVPAFLHEAYGRAEGAQRARLAVAVARAWAYGADPARAQAFAAEALGYAETHDDAGLLAAALDAQLLVHWGPDDLDDRLRITARLEDAVAHSTDVEARLSAHLWRLTTALEGLDMPVARRQLRALDGLADESGSSRVRLFAASRRGMFALLLDDLDAARAAMGEAVAAGAAAAEADTYAIERALTSAIARQAGDVPTLAREAATFESFGLQEGVMSVAAEAAVLWAEAGEPQRARRLLLELAGTDFGAVARDVDWLRTMCSLAQAAVAVSAIELADRAAEALTPYSGRAVVNAGAVGFAGLVDDHLHALHRIAGRDAEARRHAMRARADYERLGAAWWVRRMGSGPREPTATPARAVHLRPGDDGIWWIGPDGAPVPVRAVKGLHYLRLLLERPGVDVPALELSDAVSGHPGAGVDEAGFGDLLDRRAVAAYRSRLSSLALEIDEAREWSDAGRLDSLQRERDALVEQLTAAHGLGGRGRQAGATSERARVAVRKAITAAIDKVAALDPAVGRLLRDTVSTGATCRYDPDPLRPVRWVLRS